jgi:hydrogenase maturation protein HypF
VTPRGRTVLVMTSGNLGGEPIAYRDATRSSGWRRSSTAMAAQRPGDRRAVRRLGGPGGRRRAAAAAPIPRLCAAAVALPLSVPPKLAVGADLRTPAASPRTAMPG